MLLNNRFLTVDITDVEKYVDNVQNPWKMGKNPCNIHILSIKNIHYAVNTPGGNSTGRIHYMNYRR